MKDRRKTVVMKFGGTSVASLKQITEIASYVASVAKNQKVVVVVSAQGDETSRLGSLISQMCGGVSVSSPEADKILATGETISASLMALALKGIGVPARSLSGSQLRIETDKNHGGARIKSVRGIKRVKNLLDKNEVVVATGFQGVVKGGDDITTLGRGGSDLTAIAIAGALRADYCEIYTDVDGVYAIDPDIYPDVKCFYAITYTQMLQFARAGCEVLMERCIELAQDLGVSIKVLLSPSFGVSTGGTIVKYGSTHNNMEGAFEQAGIVIRGVAPLKILQIPNIPGMLSRIIGALSGIRILADNQMLCVNNIAEISFLFLPEDVTIAHERLKEIPGIEMHVGVDMVSLTLVHPLNDEGKNYLHLISTALSDAGVNIEMYHRSENSVMVVVERSFKGKAVAALAEKFQLIA